MLFPAWAAALAAGKTKKLVYAAGDEPRVREAVVGALLQTEEFERTTVRATKDNGGEVWAALNQHPVGDARRLVVVRDADQLRDWRQLPSWLKEMRTAVAVFEQRPSEFTPELGRLRTCARGHRCDGTNVKIEKAQSGRERRKCATCEETRATIVRKGSWVETARPRTEHQATAYAEMLAAYAGTGRSRAERLLRSADGRVGDCLEALDKLRLMGLELTEVTGRAALPARAENDYEAALRAGDRPRACAAAYHLPPEAARYVVARLTGWLLMVARAHGPVRAGAKTPDLVKLLGTDWVTATRVAEEAPRWTPDRVDSAVSALADTAASLTEGGRREGALQLLAARW